MIPSLRCGFVLVLAMTCAIVGGLAAVAQQPANSQPTKDAVKDNSPQEPLRVSADPLGPTAAALHQRLAAPTHGLNKGIDPGSQLRESLEFLAKAHDIVIRIDYQSFRDYASEEPEQMDRKHVQLSPQAQIIRLRTILRDILKQVDGDYLVQGNHLVVFHRCAVQNSYVEPGSENDVAEPAMTTDVEVNHRPVSDALQELADNTGLNVVIDNLATEKANARVKLNLRNVPPNVAVRTLAQLAGLRVVFQRYVFYVTTRERAEELRDEMSCASSPAAGG